MITDLRERVEALERGQKGIRLEWEDAFMRLQKVMGRLNAALKGSEDDDLPPEKGEGTPPAGGFDLIEAYRRKRARRTS